MMHDREAIDMIRDYHDAFVDDIIAAAGIDPNDVDCEAMEQLVIEAVADLRVRAATQARALAWFTRAMQPFAQEYRCSANAPQSSVGWRTVTLREQSCDAILAALSVVAALSPHTRSDP